MRLQTEMRDGTCIVRFGETRLDAAVALDAKDAVRLSVPDDARHVVLDMQQVEFLDSSGLGALVALLKHFGPDRRMDLASLRPNVVRVFRLTRMDSVFTIHPAVEDVWAGGNSARRAAV